VLASVSRRRGLPVSVAHCGDSTRKVRRGGTPRPAPGTGALPGSWRDAGSCPTSNAARWPPASLPMNLPETTGVRERDSGEHTRLACWRRRPADADFQSSPRIAATPRAKFAEAGRLGQHPGRVRSPELAFRRDQPRRCLWRGRQRPHARARALPGSWRDARFLPNNHPRALARLAPQDDNVRGSVLTPAPIGSSLWRQTGLASVL